MSNGFECEKKKKEKTTTHGEKDSKYEYSAHGGGGGGPQYILVGARFAATAATGSSMIRDVTT